MNHQKLDRLVTHLRNGELLAAWNFTTFRQTRYNQQCGCSVNELAALLSLEDLDAALAVYDKFGVTPKHVAGIANLVQAELEITPKEFSYFFLPWTDGHDHNSPEWLTEHATPAEVANLIAHYQKTGNMLCRSEEELAQIEEGDATDVSNCISDYV